VADPPKLNHGARRTVWFWIESKKEIYSINILRHLIGKTFWPSYRSIDRIDERRHFER
jgi:hypothetical protein